MRYQLTGDRLDLALMAASAPVGALAPSPVNDDVYLPQPQQIVPRAGAWVMIVRALPPLERGLNEHLRVARMFWVEHVSGNTDKIGFAPDGKYSVLCRSPWGDVRLWPYEYRRIDTQEIVQMWQAEELVFHPTAVDGVRFNDVVFYAQSRGLPLHDAAVMALGTLQGPVGWFEPAPDLALEAEAMSAHVNRWPPLGDGRKTMSEDNRRSCSVSDDECTAPAGIGISGAGWARGTGTARGTCVRCGDAVCGKCSRIVRRRRLPRGRWCNNCLDAEGLL